MMPAIDIWTLAGSLAGLVVLAFVTSRVMTGVLTLRATALVPTLSRRIARRVNMRSFSDAELLTADGAPAAWGRRREQGLDRLTSALRREFERSSAWERGLRNGFSDLRFTDASRVPFPFARAMRERFNLCSVVTASRGPYLQSLDGQWTLDVSGSYGMNVAGFDQYKTWIDKGWARVRDLGPVLGPVHPVVAENVEILKRISGLDEVSFHMSGTEAVMAAARLARFNTHRKLIVVFSGAYHGWWDGVQASLGSERTLDDCLLLKDLHPASIDVIRRRAGEIAAVLVNPVQSFHPNSPPPNDAVLLTSEARSADASTARYAAWLKQVRGICTASQVPLIFDEVYTGFRFAPGGAQAFFDIAADMVVYGKTVAGGMPIGVVCGKSWLMRRTDPDHPLRMAYVVGTFSAHPLVMGAMREFLDWVERPDVVATYVTANAQCTEWVRSTNRRLVDQSLPVRVVNLATVWTVLFTEPSRYNWLLQYYLRAEGLTLSWVGTGRCLASFDFTSADYDSLETKLVTAAEAMKRDGWWPTAAEFPERDHIMRTRLTREIAGSLVPKPLVTFYHAVMKRKDDDHHASHNNPWNQYLHLLSSSAFIVSYALLATNLTAAMLIGVVSLLFRQFGHAVLEPACHDEEALLLGYNTPTKTVILCTYLAIPVGLMAWTGTWSVSGFLSLVPAIALQWFRWTLFVVLARVVVLTFTHDFGIAIIWLTKLITDPFTDVITYRPWKTQHA
jgi:glutamate-1-semialdehyde 2,1-aminomutase